MLDQYIYLVDRTNKYTFSVDMFTGLVEETGMVEQVNPKGEGMHIVIQAKKIMEDIQEGNSILINGVCHTVQDFNESSFKVFSAPETLRITNLISLKKGSMVNLERAVRPMDRLGGHIVQGHAEGTTRVKEINRKKEYTDIKLEYSDKAIIPKGSIALDGISLTIHEVENDNFKVQIIPDTMNRTNIVDWHKDYQVNIETDYLVKSVQYMVGFIN